MKKRGKESMRNRMRERKRHADRERPRQKGIDKVLKKRVKTSMTHLPFNNESLCLDYISFILSFFPSRPIVWGRREVLSPVNHVVRMKIHQALQCTVGDGCYLLFLEGLLVDYAHRGRRN